MSNVRSHRKRPFRMVEIREIEVPLSAISGRSLDRKTPGGARIIKDGSEGAIVELYADRPRAVPVGRLTLNWPKAKNQRDTSSSDAFDEI